MKKYLMLCMALLFLENTYAQNFKEIESDTAYSEKTNSIIITTLTGDGNDIIPSYQVIKMSDDLKPRLGFNNFILIKEFLSHHTSDSIYTENVLSFRRGLLKRSYILSRSKNSIDMHAIDNASWKPLWRLLAAIGIVLIINKIALSAFYSENFSFRKMAPMLFFFMMGGIVWIIEILVIGFMSCGGGSLSKWDEFLPPVILPLFIFPFSILLNRLLRKRKKDEITYAQA